MSSQKYIFDPLSTIIKLAILANKELGSKIVVNNNSIDIQEYSLIQGITRLYFGQTKNDIHYLSIPIELACKIYLKKDTVTSIPKITLIFRCAQNGLLKLIETYKQYPVIVHCLKYYHSIIDLYINKLEESELYKEDKKEDKKEESEYVIKSIPIPIPTNNLFIPTVSQSLPIIPSKDLSSISNQVTVGSYKKKKQHKNNIINSISNDNTLNTINILNNNESPKDYNNELYLDSELLKVKGYDQAKEVKEVKEVEEAGKEATKEVEEAGKEATKEPTKEPTKEVEEATKEATKEAEEATKEADKSLTFNSKEDSELISQYTDTILNKLTDIWSESNIIIIIEMIEYLLDKTTITAYEKCIETFMISIDDKVRKILN